MVSNINFIGLFFLSTKKQEESKEEVKETQKEETDPFAEFGEQISVDDNFLE